MRAALLVLALTTGCATARPLYDWGEYESTLEQLARERDGADADEHIERLSSQLARTTAEGKLVPPGVHAHLGWLLANRGDLAGAREQLTAEKEAFPESAAFVDRILNQLDAASAAPTAAAEPAPAAPARQAGAP